MKRGQRERREEACYTTPGGKKDERQSESQRRKSGTAFHQKESVLERDPVKEILPGPGVHNPQFEECYRVGPTHRDTLHVTTAPDDGNRMANFMDFPSWNK